MTRNVLKDRYRKVVEAFMCAYKMEVHGGIAKGRRMLLAIDTRDT